MKKVIHGNMIDSDGDGEGCLSKEVKLMCDLHDKEEPAMRSPRQRMLLAGGGFGVQLAVGRPVSPEWNVTERWGMMGYEIREGGKDDAI